MNSDLIINSRVIGAGQPTYMIAEMSANHHHDFDMAVKLMEAAKAAGADAVKLQTYTPDTMTIDCDNDYFRVKGTIWDGRTLYDLYGEAYTPWDWQPKLKKIAEELGMDLFSTPFDASAVDFLMEMDVPVIKVASFENVDLPLLRKIARQNKPIIMSTGMASLAEIDEAVQTIFQSGNRQLALLKCTSSYPSPVDEINLKTIPHLSQAFNVPVGLSDHTMGESVPAAAAALGACIIEKHFTLSRAQEGPDSSFSLEPDEFKRMVDSVRIVEKALGQVNYGMTKREETSRVFRRTLWCVADIKAGQLLTSENVRAIRPGNGMHTRYLGDVLGQRAVRDIVRGTPLSWDLIGGGDVG